MDFNLFTGIILPWSLYLLPPYIAKKIKQKRFKTWSAILFCVVQWFICIGIYAAIGLGGFTLPFGMAVSFWILRKKTELDKEESSKSN